MFDTILRCTDSNLRCPRPPAGAGRLRALVTAAALLAVLGAHGRRAARRPTAARRRPVVVARRRPRDRARRGCVAVACAAWLAAHRRSRASPRWRRGRHAAAHAHRRVAPRRSARRILQAALVGTSRCSCPRRRTPSPTTARAARRARRRHGRLALTPMAPTSSESARDETPVVRAPPARRHPTTTPPYPTRPPSTRSRSTGADARAAVAPPSRPRVARPAPVAPIAARSTRTYVVRAGDNLWRIARTEVARRAAATPDRRGRSRATGSASIAANRATLRSGDPSLIFPGEVVTLP